MGKLDLNILINITITEGITEEFRKIKEMSQHQGGFSSVSALAHYIHVNFRANNLDDSIKFIIFPIVKRLGKLYGLNDDEGLSYIIPYFKERKWGEYMPYVTARLSYYGIQ